MFKIVHSNVIFEKVENIDLSQEEPESTPDPNITRYPLSKDIIIFSSIQAGNLTELVQGIKNICIELRAIYGFEWRCSSFRDPDADDYKQLGDDPPDEYFEKKNMGVFD